MLEILFFLVVILLGLTTLLRVTVTFSRSVTGFVSAGESGSASDNEGVVANPTSVPAAQPGTLSTRVSNTSGTLTMTNTNHGITTGQRLDLFWTGGQAYDITAGTVSGTSVPFSVTGGGSNLPIATTVINVGIATAVGFGITGNNLASLVASTPNNGYIVFNNGSADVLAIYLPANRIYSWDSGNGQANPLSGATPTTVYFSHNNTAAAVATMQACAVTH